jgi:hypothetical protein
MSLGGPLTGIIAIWSGSVASIPTGWLLCDGTNGTPDLRDRFVPGAGGSLSPGATGGANSHVHTLTINAAQDNLAGGNIIANSAPAGTINTVTVGHTHTGGANSASNVPAFYALAYIMHE